ncbi:hypothetical protein ACERII_24260 [Evansella sp. AB-rgal1]|uniref:hypothetical protein n=1 Tax=Evansella sp. AB-rgal1 TaxID=3242696 RepID=UPI00359D8745
MKDTISCVDEYIQNILTPQLTPFLEDTSDIETIVHDVHLRLVDAISLWNEQEVRDTLFLPVTEEAMYYKPYAPIEIRCLVVLCIRNSLLETYASYPQDVIEDKHIPLFTGEAIQYFRNMDLGVASHHLLVRENNQFLLLKQNYPVAWNALHHLAFSKKRQTKFPPVEKEELMLEELENAEESTEIGKEVTSGMDATISPILASQLKSIEQGVPFFVDSFKYLTRHPEKLFLVLEFLLRKRSMFVSFNYLIANGEAHQRTTLQQPAFSQQAEEQIREKFFNHQGLSKRHQKILQFVSTYFQKTFRKKQRT